MLDQNDYLPAYGKEGQEVLLNPSINGSEAEAGVRGVFTHKGRFIQYNLLGFLFDVTAKFRPPIKPISRGAYGIVW
jgi:hypothetical protein